MRIKKTHISFPKYNNVRVIMMKIKVMKGKAPRKHSLHEKTAASVLLKNMTTQ